MSLRELGWGASLEMDPDGDISAVIETPPYESVYHFILPGEDPRLVLDFTGTYLPGTERSLGGLGKVEGIRFAQFEPEISRVVLDLETQSGYTIEQNPQEGITKIQLTSGDLSGMKIVIDPGHGGEDPGANQNGIQEKDLNLEMALILRDLLVAKGAVVILTRDSDVYVPLKERVDVARNNDADLFISVHNNSSDYVTDAQGILLLYNNENNMPLYHAVHVGVVAKTGVTGQGPIRDERGLYILRHLTNMPVLYIEAAFITNPEDVYRLIDGSRAYVRDIMTGVSDGIMAHYVGYPLPDIDIPGFDDGSIAVANYGSGEASGSVITETTTDWDLPLEIAQGEIPVPDEASVVQDDDSNDESAESDDDSGSDDEADNEEDDDEDDENDNHRRRGRGGYRYR